MPNGIHTVDLRFPNRTGSSSKLPNFLINLHEVCAIR